MVPTVYLVVRGGSYAKKLRGLLANITRGSRTPFAAYEALAFHPVCTTACPLKGKHVATSLFLGVRRLRSTKEPQLVVRLPARMRTGLKHGHGPLEDRVVVLGRFEVDETHRE